MSALSSMQPRDREEAGRTVLFLTSVAALVTVFGAVVAPSQAGSQTITYYVVLPATGLISLGAWGLGRAMGNAEIAWALFPFIAVALIAGLDLATHDASTLSQIFLFFPVLYAGFNLPRPGAIAVTAAAVAGNAVVAFPLLELRNGIADTFAVGAALISSAGVLVFANERRAALLAVVQRQAAVDPLTGLATRRVLDQTANSVLGGAFSSTGTALILVDVDHFKSVNDVHGHIAGDEVLVAIAELLTRNVRPDSVVGRLGGDEIAMLLPGCAEDAALRRAEQICAEVRDHPFVVLDGNQTLRLSVSVGVAHAPTHADDLRSLYAAADAALYAAKRSGRDQAALVPPMDTEAPAA